MHTHVGQGLLIAFGLAVLIFGVGGLAYLEGKIVGYLEGWHAAKKAFDRPHVSRGPY